jgi:lipopolysaccharide assembly protein A
MSRDAPQPPAGRDRKKLAAGLILGSPVVVFAVLNLDEVRVNWILGEWNTPLIVVILVSLVFGALLGYLAGRRRDRGR